MFKHWLKLLLFLLVISPPWVSPTFATDQPFNFTLRMFKPITVTKNKDLIFPERTLDGTDETVVVGTGDTGAADFTVFGGKNRSVVRTVLESNITLTASGAVGGITVDTFAVAGPLAFNESGKADGFKIGATARISAGSEDGDYAGEGTFRVIYQ